MFQEVEDCLKRFGLGLVGDPRLVGDNSLIGRSEILKIELFLVDPAWERFEGCRKALGGLLLITIV